ncbi:ABC-2 type transport system permease protein [Paenibacillus cellulosilyticus]|uniref:ABC-2 type transport system permease protein n=1 Tax=Paenibacillus cellulosilyticus TaxID=375489 RepID=A0A2V2YN59_9BACL|nr:ABC transporter permease [Paenibacillus cellulosilyticus]PWV95735.1 ABC-2 type transport system permease protein [Paenibacillus cellulosilyticus]QKS47633.1 ABC transporter permease [Paenibacillus cellulosilyticus]
MSKFWTVVGFTIRNKIKAKSYVISTLILVAIISVVVNLPYMIDKFSSDAPDKIGYLTASTEEATQSSVTPSVVGDQMREYFSKQEHPDYEFVPIENQNSDEANEQKLLDALSNGDIDAYATFEEDGTSFPAMVLHADKVYSETSKANMQAALQSIKTQFALQGLGLTDEQQTALFSQAVVDSVKVDISNGEAVADDTKEKAGALYGAVYLILFLLFMTIMGSGQLIATEITAEKSSRVMEVLITSVSPLTQMFGKIFGMFIVGIGQTALLVAAAAVNLSLPHNESALNNIGVNIKDIPLDVFIYAIAFYLIGYFLFATLYAGVGSLVSRTEDLGQAVMPLMFLNLGGFYIGIFGLNAADASFVKVASFIPFFTPYAMFMRIGMSSVPVWEIMISLAVLLITTFVCGWLSAKIYRTGVLLYGKRPTIKELRKAMKAYKL